MMNCLKSILSFLAFFEVFDNLYVPSSKNAAISLISIVVTKYPKARKAKGRSNGVNQNSKYEKPSLLIKPYPVLSKNVNISRMVFYSLFVKAVVKFMLSNSYRLYFNALI